MKLPARIFPFLLLAVTCCPVPAAASFLEIYKTDLLLARIPNAYNQRIANKQLIANHQNYPAISLIDLFRMLRVRGENVILAGSGSSQTVPWSALKQQNVSLCFPDHQTVKVYSENHGLSPNVLERITVTKENYFPPRFIVLICGLALSLLVIFLYSKNIWFRFGALFITIYLIYLPFDLPTFGNRSDNLWYVPTSLSILTQGNFELSEWSKLSNLDRIDYRIVKVHGLPYSSYPLGTSLLTLPVVFAGSLIYRETNSDEERVYEIASFAAKVVASLSVALLFLVAFRLTESTSLSLFLAFLFAFATNQFNTHAGGLWSHNTGSLLLLMALPLLASENDRFASLSAIPLGLAYITRPTYSIVILIVSIYLLLYRRRALPAYLLWGAVLGLGFFGLNYAVYGRFLTSYQGQSPHAAHFVEALAGNLISPNRGLFAFAPFFLWSVYGMYLSFQERDRIPPFYRLLSVIVIAHWVMISPQAPYWSAGYYIGPRKFCDVLPIWMLLLIPSLRKLVIASPRRNWLLIPVWILAVGWSVFVQYRSVTDLSVYQWNHRPVRLEDQPSRVWDWDDWQILRKERPENNLSARIPEGLFRSLATTRIGAVKENVMPVQELVAACEGPGSQFIFRGSGKTFSLRDDQLKNVYVYFFSTGKSSLKIVRLISTAHPVPRMPDGLWQIVIR